jgi:penicillin amidase
MFVTLQDTDGSYESTLGTMHDVLPQPMFEFVAPKGTEWDTPVVGERFSTPPIPGPDVYNLRSRRAGRTTLPLPERPPRVSLAPGTGDSGLGTWDLGSGIWALGFADREAIGSNNWAVSGALTPDGRAIVANDMHLAIRVPNTWYRASMEWRDSARTEPHVLIGRDAAWGGLRSSRAVTPTSPGDSPTRGRTGATSLSSRSTRRIPNRYRTPDGWRDFERFRRNDCRRGRASANTSR